jgi:phenylpropionate dioxygenase-like ring-hydroxylating dioxygenase large terminal subunit
VNVATDPEPFDVAFAPMIGRLTRFGLPALAAGHRVTYEVRANWKLVFQNYSECLHCPIVHPLLQKQSHYLSGFNEVAATYSGGPMELGDGVKTLSLDGQTNRSSLAGLSSEDQRRVYYYGILPNLLLNLHPDYMLTFTLWPKAADRTDVVCEWHFHPDQIAAPGFDPSGSVEFWDLTNKQDWALSDLAQQGIGSRGYAPGPYSNREELLHAFDRFVVERTR